VYKQFCSEGILCKVCQKITAFEECTHTKSSVSNTLVPLQPSGGYCVPLSLTRPAILYRNKSKREGCRWLSLLFHLTAPAPPKIEKALFAAAEAERQSRYCRMDSFLSAKLGIKTTGQCSPCSTCKANEILCLGIKSCTMQCRMPLERNQGLFQTTY
jgi:hypothetical protein